MNILLLGSGGREHALAWKLSKSPLCEKLFVAPGNGGTSDLAHNVKQLDIESGSDVVNFAHEQNIGLIVIGPEAPLVAGVADACLEAGIPVFGPTRKAAQLEGSKSFSKAFMFRHNLPTAAYEVFDAKDAALSYLEGQRFPLVIKADGLAAGKGVVIADTLEMAKRTIEDCFEGVFGNAGSRVVIEEFLTGPECSLLAFVSNGQALCMPPAQDHKRAYDGDLGPNTGGMGVYSPVPMVTEEELAAMQTIMQKAAQASLEDPEVGGYCGVLYGGFMLTTEGPKLLEFNARFGDPETQVILPCLESDLVEIMLACAKGDLNTLNPQWSSLFAVAVVLASEGYPGLYEKGKVILGIADAEELEDAMVFHAGTARNFDEELVTAGGRVLNVVALASSFELARNRAYEACERIDFEGKQLRSDIGLKALQGRDL